LVPSTSELQQKKRKKEEGNVTVITFYDV
jgi:hypothetical protein